MFGNTSQFRSNKRLSLPSPPFPLFLRSLPTHPFNHLGMNKRLPVFPFRTPTPQTLVYKATGKRACSAEGTWAPSFHHFICGGRTMLVFFLQRKKKRRISLEPSRTNSGAKLNRKLTTSLFVRIIFAQQQSASWFPYEPIC